LDKILLSAAIVTPERVFIPTAAPAWLMASIAYSTFSLNIIIHKFDL
jgi:hypothetical protein